MLQENKEFHAEKEAQEKPLSAEFKDWKEDDKKLKEFLEGSHVFTDPWDKSVAWEGWEDGRRFIEKAINKDGAILDYGCANGFFLRSLQEWANYKLEPYGIDVDDGAIEKAKKMFPEKTDHFICEKEGAPKKDFPRNFDFVFWNVWDDFEFDTQNNAKLLQELQEITKEGGRLILGLYDTKDKNRAKVQQLIKLGFQPTDVMENPRGEQQIVIFEKASREKQ